MNDNAANIRIKCITDSTSTCLTTVPAGKNISAAIAVKPTVNSNGDLGLSTVLGGDSTTVNFSLKGQATGDLVFASSPICFTNLTAAPTVCSTPQDLGWSWSLSGNKTKLTVEIPYLDPTMSWKYTLYFEDKQTGGKAFVDPMIKNDGSPTILVEKLSIVEFVQSTEFVSGAIVGGAITAALVYIWARKQIRDARARTKMN